MYEINMTNRTCKKSPLKADFQPLAIPKDAALLGQVVVGSSSGPGEGLLVNTWGGDLPNKGGERASTLSRDCQFIHTLSTYLFHVFREVHVNRHRIWMHPCQYSVPH